MGRREFRRYDPPRDGPRLRDLNIHSGNTWTKRVQAIVRTELADALVHSSLQAHAWVCDDRDQGLLGVACWHPRHTQRRRAELRVLAVDKRHRNQGIGSELLARCLEDIKAAGFSEVIGDFHVRNSAIRNRLLVARAAIDIDPSDPNYCLFVIRLR